MIDGDAWWSAAGIIRVGRAPGAENIAVFHSWISMFSSSASDSSASDPVYDLARRHGLELSGALDVNELGLDFRVVTAADRAGRVWILRIPRRGDVLQKIEREARTLSLLKGRVPFAVPDWRIVSDELVGYPRLNDPTAIQVDVASGGVTWNIDKDSDAFVSSLGGALAALHRVPVQQAVEAGLRSVSAAEMRGQTARDIERVSGSFQVYSKLKQRWAEWLDDDTSWPDFVVVVHGDLYPGHMLVDAEDRVTGMIDWTEAEIHDPSMDFAAHLLLFGEAGLERLIEHYGAAGGRTWPRMAHHTKERLALSPIKYALFAMESGDPAHMEIARGQLLAS